MVLATVSFAAVVEWSAHSAGQRADARAVARRHLPRDYCTSCHSDSHSVQVMREKEDREGAENLPGGILDPDAVPAAHSR
jgi:hypothetical protein